MVTWFTTEVIHIGVSEGVTLAACPCLLHQYGFQKPYYNICLSLNALSEDLVYEGFSPCTYASYDAASDSIMIGNPALK